MEYVVVERAFNKPYSVGEIQDLRDQMIWCMEQNRIRYLHGYLSADGKRMVCIYEAPDAESVRRINLQSGLPFDRIWKANLVR